VIRGVFGNSPLAPDSVGYRSTTGKTEHGFTNVPTTANTGKEREQFTFGDPLETIWRNCIFGLCGIDSFYRLTFSVVVTSTERERKQWLDEARATIDKVFPKNVENTT